jgi:ABC-2 type transport system ATP-binding protein
MKSIVIKGLKRNFGKFTAVNGISFDVEKGEIFGFLGPNGAGKTTTISMLSTLLKITSGSAEVAGIDVSKDRDGVRKKIGIVFQDTALDGKLTGRENLEFHAIMHKMRKEDYGNKINELAKLVELDDKLDNLVETYSGGMKRRLEIARGLIHEPEVLFLDEPTLGLDAQTRRKIWDYIRNLNHKTRITILITTHYMEEADTLCSRVAIIDNGSIVALDTPANLKNVIGGDVIRMDFGNDCSKLVSMLKRQKWVKDIKKHNCSLDISVELGERKIPKAMELAKKTKTRVESISLHKPSLEDVFLHFTGKTIREQEASQNDRNRHMMTRRHG